MAKVTVTAMDIGYFLPHIGSFAGRDAVARAAKRAEELGYHSVWVLDRVLYPIKPQSPYPATPDGSLPEQYKRVLDPLETLTFVAARTQRIRLGTSVLDMPYYNPVMLARQLTTLDVLSGGRLEVGFGQGWSKDEHEATGTPMKNRGPRADEFLRVLKTIWTTDPVEFQGKYFHVSKSIIQPKPVQKPHPPIYLAAYSATALKRAAIHANGWLPTGVPWDKMKEMADQMRGMAKNAGRNPADLKIVLLANISVTPQSLPQERWMFTGDLQQLGSDIQRAREFGITELILGPAFSPDSQTEQGYFENMERLSKLV